MPRRTRPRTLSGAEFSCPLPLDSRRQHHLPRERPRRGFVFARSTQNIKDGSGRHITYHARLQQVLALVIAQCFKWKQVQCPVRGNDESCSRLRFRDRLQEHSEQTFRVSTPAPFARTSSTIAPLVVRFPCANRQRLNVRAPVCHRNTEEWIIQ